MSILVNYFVVCLLFMAEGTSIPKSEFIITSLLRHYYIITISLSTPTFPLSAGDSLMSGTLPGPTVSLVGVALGFEGEGAVCERKGRLLRRSNLRLRIYTTTFINYDNISYTTIIYTRVLPSKSLVPHIHFYIKWNPSIFRQSWDMTNGLD